MVRDLENLIRESTTPQLSEAVELASDGSLTVVPSNYLRLLELAAKAFLEVDE